MLARLYNKALDALWPGRPNTVYARLLSQQVKKRHPLTRQTYTLDNSKQQNANQVVFSGYPQFITTAQVEQALKKTDKQQVNIETALPKDLPAEIRTLLTNYQTGRQKTIGSKILDPAIIRPALQKLHETILAQSTMLALQQTAERFGETKQNFIVLLLAGSARGQEFDSDLDYLIVYQDNSKVYFNYLAAQLKTILFQIGVDGDNLLERFTSGKKIALALNDYKAYYTIMRATTEVKPLPGFSDKSILTEFMTNRACLSTGQLKKPSVWHDYLYSIAIRQQSTAHALINPALEARKINTSIQLLLAQADLINQPQINNQPTLDFLANKGWLEQETAEKIGQATKFFALLRNALWCLSDGSRQYFMQNDLKNLTNCLRKNDTLGQESLLLEIQLHKAATADFYKLARQKAGFTSFWQRSYFSWRQLKVKTSKLLSFLRNGKIRVLFRSNKIKTCY